MLLKSLSRFENSEADLIYRSLKPELESQITDRASVSIWVEDGYIFLEVSSDDLVAMRSTLNTWLRLIQVSFETADCIV
ncbi:KEOPS complex subunit Pcc1 [Methanolobus bombayensis]|uniref:KEOPS complex subunit Pcc1 n=1 Tax=Methanolobus bombayensis TaxID=38023 RepID=UPI001AE9023C|nr:KEOPS complex subunit Pcc1 [Methanolobus bombayensis]MBP1908781.1 KEOPS complex subunit Pcc1 [Methanolobus bombayensis]